MISFNRLGYKGRLGNQMFQYAATLGIARKIGTSASCNIGHDLCTIGKCFQLGSVNDSIILFDKMRTYKEPKFNFNEEVFHFDPNSCVDLDGYFQTERYFKHIDGEIRKNFKFKEDIEHEASDVFQILGIEPSNTVSLHIRRGDYVAIQNHHPLQTIEYYMNGLDILNAKREMDVLVISDDIHWCIQNLKGSKYKYCTSSPFVDMCVMSKCSGHVIANSSFSWWAAWLSGNPTVAPKTWFGPATSYDWNDIYCEGWTIL